MDRVREGTDKEVEMSAEGEGVEMKMLPETLDKEGSTPAEKKLGKDDRSCPETLDPRIDRTMEHGD